MKAQLAVRGEVEDWKTMLATGFLDDWVSRVWRAHRKCHGCFGWHVNAIRIGRVFEKRRDLAKVGAVILSARYTRAILQKLDYSAPFFDVV